MYTLLGAMPSCPSLRGMMDPATLPQSPLLMHTPVPGSPGLGQEDLALQKAWELSLLLDDGSAWQGGARLQPETVSSPLALGHFCQAPRCPLCIGRAWDCQTGHSEGTRKRQDSEKLEPQCLSLRGMRLSLSAWGYHRNPWKFPKIGETAGNTWLSVI